MTTPPRKKSTKKAAAAKKPSGAASTRASAKPRGFAATRVGGWLVGSIRWTKGRITGLLQRRPHRSFRRTKRRDYKRSLKLPGYFQFGKEVFALLWRHRKTFGLLFVIYVVLSAYFVGLASQDTYSQLSDLLKQTGGDVFQGKWGDIGEASLLFISTVTGSIRDTPTEAQQIYAAILGILVWLTTVWLLRAVLAGRKLKLRDAIYNSGAPIFSTFLVGLVLLIQLIPFAIALFAYAAAQNTGIFQSGVEAMAFWAVLGSLTLLSIYWGVSTVIALVIVTLPGMYPMEALRVAGDLVVGRRLRIMLRVLYMVLATVVWWAVILIPMILFDSWIKNVWSAVAWVPFVPITILVLSTGTAMWYAAYVYVLYRRIVDDDAKPA